MSAQPRGARPHKEAFFVQVKSADDRLTFFDATAQLGKEMPYARPEATCALRVKDNAVIFSLLKLSNRTRANLAGAKLELPRGPLARLERRAASLGELAAGTVVVELGEQTHTLVMTSDENGVATLDTLPEVDDVTFELPKSALTLSLYLVSPRNGRIVAAGFIGHVGKPGANETLLRVASFALNHLSGLPVFRLVSGIETVHVPAPPARAQVTRPARKPSDEVAFTVPVRIWSEEAQPTLLITSSVGVKVDLDTANPVSGRLLFHFTPAAEIADGFEPYKATFEKAVSDAMTAHRGLDEINDIVFSIALGELGEGEIGRLRESAATIAGFDLTTKQSAPFSAA